MRDFFASPEIPQTLILVWGMFCVNVALWGLLLVKTFTVGTEHQAWFWSYVLNVIAIPIHFIFLHFVVSFTNLISAKYLRYTYTAAGLLAVAVLIKPRWYISGAALQVGLPFYPQGGPLFYIFALIFFVLFV